MLNRLIIQNYALIDSLDISFAKGLTILTGETGAGKSIILGALSLILGRRMDGKYFFNQQKKCVIEGFFQIKDYHLNDFFSENDIDYESQTILRREISTDGKSRAFINDTPVSLNTLKQFTEKLITIHSQHANLEINEPDFQLFVLDTVAGNQSLLDSYQLSYKTYSSLNSQLKELELSNYQAKIDQDYYQFLLDELNQANLKEGEQEQLEQEFDALTHAADIKSVLSQASYLLNDHEQAALRQLKEVSQSLEQTKKYQAAISSLSERLISSIIEIKDIASEIDQIGTLTLIDEDRSSEISSRLNVLYSLEKKHRANSTTELITAQNNISKKLQTILSSDEKIQRLKAEKDQLKEQLMTMAANLSDKRKEIIPKLELQIQQILVEMGMPHAILEIRNELHLGGKLNKMGLDQIQFLFSANKGQVPLPMHEIASGGELSRLMLTIKSLIASHTTLATIIFDEIDTGISGEIARKVGHIMEKLATHMQVITITHLPQIASKGSLHYCIYKDEQDEHTHTGIRKLDELARLIEIAKMLSGANPGEHALQNARELLAV